nr:hypothetical protein CFP56_36593 [Quercus suber]
MVDFTFNIEIHGGSVHTLTEIDPNKLSFFEIRDLCHLVGAPKEHSRYRYLLPEVEYPDRGGVADDGVGGDVGGVGGDRGRDEIDVESDYDEKEDDDENVEDIEFGDRVEKQDADVEEQNVEGDDDDDDWLYEGLEGDDFGDDIFVTPNSAPQDLEWADPALEDDLVSMDGSDDKQARGGVPAFSTRSGFTPQPPSQHTQTYNMRSATQPSSSQQGNQAS